MNFFQKTLQAVEVGRSHFIARLIPLIITIVAVAFLYNFGPVLTPVGTFGGIYHGLSDAQSMDNAQLGRQLSRGQGFTTEFLRPMALRQLRDHQVAEGRSPNLFPANLPADTLRIVPDTYNAPGYPLLLAAWFRLTHPDFNQTPTAIGADHFYSPDRWLPLLNTAFMLMTAVLVFMLGLRLFDQRVAWLSLIAFLGTDLIWRFTITALSTSFLMLLITAALICALEIVCTSEECFENENRTFTPAWFWAIGLALLLAAATLTRLHLLILIIPLFVFFLSMPRSSVGVPLLIALVVLGAAAPWFYHMYKATGNILGSNFALVLYGQSDYEGNQIYCGKAIPEYEHLFKNIIAKEMMGLRWQFEHAWNLMGCNPIILLFAVSIFHLFKRRRTRLFHWLIFGCAIFLLAVNDLGSIKPEPVDSWNCTILFFPCMIVYGSAFFFILLDRLSLQIQLLQTLIVLTTTALTLAPLFLTLTSGGLSLYAFPPYLPPMIKALGQYDKPEEWITTDMPWATAWYADRGSLWLPDSLADFKDINENVCPTGILMLTPVSWSQPLNTFTTGEYKDWYPFVTEGPLPSGFSLNVHTKTAPGGPDYFLWSDRIRWQNQ